MKIFVTIVDYFIELPRLDFVNGWNIRRDKLFHI